MGMDIVEFVMAVEDRFGLRIPNDVAATLTTPRVINYIYGVGPRQQGPQCVTQRCFYAVRRALSERLKLPRSVLRPKTSLRAVLPAQNADDIWAEIG
jgi:hypothetical protein